MKSTLLALVLLLGLNASAWADRIKDLANVAAGRTNQLIGYGLVVGLQGTGDGADVSFTAQSMKSMLSRMGVSLDGPLSDFEQGTSAGKIDIKNVAAVMVTAELPAFAKPGQKIDVNVSAIGKATNLRGGNLLLTSLRGVDGEVYGIAQGALTATGIDANAAGSKVSIGVPTSSRIPNGATVERMVETPFETSDHVVLNVRESDFTTTTAIVNAVNKNFGEGTARAIDGMSLAIRAPADMSQRVAFMSLVENLDVVPGEPPARVVVNSRTGTVVIGQQVRVGPAAISHGSLTVTIQENTNVSQPNAFAGGQTVATPQSTITATNDGSRMFKFNGGTSLDEIVHAVNAVGAAPGDLIAILEALKQAGALSAELEVI